MQQYNISNMDVKNETKNVALYQVQSSSYNAQDDLKTLGQAIKDREASIKFLNSQKNALEDSILDLRVKLGKLHSANMPGEEAAMNSASVQSMQETTESILKHDKSAASVLCQLQTYYGSHGSEHPLSKHVLGIVCTLCKVEDDNISGLLSEFLGKENMLAVVCKNYEGVKALETYGKDGSIIRSYGLHALGASSVGRFTVICLEKLRPYCGEFITGDNQRRLDLLKPRLPNGETPPGFMGFGVNMISIDGYNLFGLTANGHGLRETLFYHLFSRLQVYKTRAEMLQAIPFIDNGAISLDGGIMKAPGIFTLGQREDVGVKFPISPGLDHAATTYLEIQNRIKKMEWKKKRIEDDKRREESLLDDVKHKFDFKKQEFVTFLASANSSYLVSPEETQAGGQDRMVLN
ncbi:protein DEFECTIVE IN MERISTEM SILENCING 3-like isoform X2 [Impatiens glandulifera]|uniref:protein DEFECTIVE IN MERISTEM SILENCING 3-like isoform X2 n=1 Tax=Impatiens glandulifera TaxID=253017 RepID=UPI001FB0C3F3|nr:protein DEFECTIVE IN MERISTEM SILENCING 3-like isoform X2 [Impatiens glandulifera]